MLWIEAKAYDKATWNIGFLIGRTHSNIPKRRVMDEQNLAFLHSFVWCLWSWLFGSTDWSWLLPVLWNSWQLTLWNSFLMYLVCISFHFPWAHRISGSSPVHSEGLISIYIAFSRGWSGHVLTLHPTLSLAHIQGWSYWAHVGLAGFIT